MAASEASAIWPKQTIESAISSVPAFQGANVTVKVLVMENNNGTIHF
jgi:hypothetical protein